MKSLLVTSVLRLLSFLLAPSTVSNTEMIQVVHPDLELYYLDMLRSEGKIICDDCIRYTYCFPILPSRLYEVAPSEIIYFVENFQPLIFLHKKNWISRPQYKLRSPLVRQYLGTCSTTSPDSDPQCLKNARCSTSLSPLSPHFRTPLRSH